VIRFLRVREAPAIAEGESSSMSMQTDVVNINFIVPIQLPSSSCLTRIKLFCKRKSRISSVVMFCLMPRAGLFSRSLFVIKSLFQLIVNFITAVHRNDSYYDGDGAGLVIFYRIGQTIAVVLQLNLVAIMLKESLFFGIVSESSDSRRLAKTFLNLSLMGVDSDFHSARASLLNVSFVVKLSLIKADPG
jgi:hypothetical protein